MKDLNNPLLFEDLFREKLAKQPKRIEKNTVSIAVKIFNDCERAIFCHTILNSKTSITLPEIKDNIESSNQGRLDFTDGQNRSAICVLRICQVDITKKFETFLKFEKLKKLSQPISQ